MIKLLGILRVGAALFGGTAALLGTAGAALSQPAASEALQLDGKIPLGNVAGRIDHMAVDLARGRLFVAELGNNSVGVVDVNERKVVHRIAALKEPQGVGYAAATDTLFVANAGDGAVQLFGGADYAKTGTIALGDDADNIRIDRAANRVVIGYGGGALAVIDAASRRTVATIALDAHPESFQIGLGGTRIFVNLPSAHAIAVVDAATGKRIATWPTPGLGGNFAMTLDQEAQKAIVAFRKPAKLVAFSMVDGGAASADTCGDIDDVFLDAKRSRIYVSCGEGFVDVFDKMSTPYRRISRIRTVAGARTSLFVPELDRLFVAVRANGGEPAAIWVFRPTS